MLSFFCSLELTQVSTVQALVTTSWATVESLIHSSNLSPAVEKKGGPSDQLLGNIGPENGVGAFRFRSYACTYLSEVLKEPGSVKGRKPYLSRILSGKISWVSERNASVSTLRMSMYVSVFGVGATAWAATSGCWKAFLEGWVWFSCRILTLLSGVANMRPELNCSSSWTGGWVLPLYSTSGEESASFPSWSWIMKENPFDCQILSWPHVSGSSFACGTLILCLRVTPNVSP